MFYKSIDFLSENEKKINAHKAVKNILRIFSYQLSDRCYQTTAIYKFTFEQPQIYGAILLKIT